MLHIGAFRTALFSWLLARHTGGDFLLRIEDTDQNRQVPGSLENIIDSLLTMGLSYDEGPDKTSVAALPATYGTVRPELLLDSGGEYGPYFQSQRLARYNEVIAHLLETGAAYYAFETKEDLEAARAAAEAAKLPYRYDRKFRDYPLAEAQARVDAGEPHAIRFKMPLSGTIRTVDALRGPTDWDAETQDDFIIKKGDGFPPYHLASMVDDHDMAITHILRGEEWISSYPKHVCIFAAMGWDLPVFVHTPSVLGPDGKKLSKRHGALGVSEYIDQGFLRETLTNFLAITGWAPGDDTEIMPLDDIIRKFSIDGISVSPAIFDIEKMKWMNGQYIAKLSPERFGDLVLPFLIRAGLVSAAPTDVEKDYALRVALLEQTKGKLLADFPDLVGFLFGDLPEYVEKSVNKWLKREGVPAYLESLGARFVDMTDWNAAAIEVAVREVGAAHAREKGELVHPVRVAISGREVGPGLYEMIAVLGPERTRLRLTRALELARA